MTTSLKTYPKYKASGMEWVNSIPSDWDIMPLRYCCRENIQKNKSLSNTDILSLSYGKVIQKDSDTNFGLVPESYAAYQILDVGDIVMRLTDLQNDHTSLRTGLVANKGIITSAYLGLKVRKQRIDDRFLHWLLHSYDLQKVFYGMGGGIRQTVGFDDLKWLPVLIPNIETQQTIAVFLDERTKAIDELVAKKERMIELLREKRESLITQVVTKGLDPSAKMKSTGSDWLEKVPSGWEKIPLKFLFSYQSGGVWGDEARNDENDAICVRVADFDFIEFVAHSDDFTYRNLPDLKKSLVLDENSILLEKSGGGDQQPVGRAVRYLGTERATCSNFIQKLQVDKKYSSEFVILLLSMLYFNGVTMKVIKKTTGIQNLDLGAFLRTDVFLPSAEEQQRIVEFINTKSLKMTDAMKETKKQIEQLKEYRSSLIYSAVTGKIKI